MVDDVEMHPAVELLLKRMDSHPEEFVGDNLPDCGSRAEVLRNLVDNMLDNVEGPAVLPIKEKMDQLHLDMYHRALMDELLNGEDKRAREAATQEVAKQQALQARQQTYLAQLQQAQNGAYSQSPSMLQGLAGSSPSAYGGGGGGGGVGIGSVTPSTPLVVANGGTAATTLGNTITGLKANSIMIDDQVLDASMIKKMKRMMLGRSK